MVGTSGAGATMSVMRRLLVVLACIAVMPATGLAQRGLDESAIREGTRVRLSVTDHVLPHPYARAGKLRTVSGTLRSIEADTVRVETVAGQPPVVVPRILIEKVERSLGETRSGSAGDAALVGGGLGAVSMGFFREKLQLIVFGTGYVLGAIVGAIHPYERWEEAWLPE